MRKLLLSFIIIVSETLVFANTEINDTQYRFRKLSPESGFSHEAILSIVIDDEGYVWFNTINSIYQYDGYTFQSFAIDYNTDAPFIVNTVYHDSKNNIWASTGQGIFKLNKLTSTYELHSKFSDNVIKFIEGANGTFWVQVNNKIAIYDPEKMSLINSTNIPQNNSTKQSVFNNGHDTYLSVIDKILQIYKQNKSTLKWDFLTNIPITGRILSIKIIGVNIFLLEEKEGLYEFNLKTHFLTKHGFLGDKQAENNNIWKTLFVDSEQKLLVGTQRGLYIYNPSKKTYKKFINQPDAKFCLPNNSVYCMLEDQSGGLWIGGYSGSFAYCNPKYDQPFQTIRQRNASLSNANFISTIVEGINNTLWLGSEGGGVILYNRNTNEFKNFRHSSLQSSISNDNVKALLLDPQKNMWVAMFNGGIDIFKPDNSSNSIKFLNIIPNRQLYCMKMDGDSAIWIAGKGKLLRYELKTKKIQFVDLPSVAKDIFPFTIYHLQIANNHLWLATTNGLLKLKLGSKKVDRVYFKSNENTPDYLFLLSILPDSKNNLWLGSANNGLYYYNTKNDSISHVREVNSGYIYSILNDNKNTLWLGTNSGLCSYNYKSKRTRFFTDEDGIQSNLFYPNSATKLSTGELVFGGTNGFTIFNPDKITENLTPPKTLIKSITINNNLYKKDLSQKIKLKYNENVIRINFTAINYLMPNKNKFAYKLEGKDANWIETNAETHYVIYSNLPSGNYTFKLKSANNDGVWNNNIVSVKFKVLPAPWFSAWAYLLYIIISGVIIWLITRYYTEKNQYRENLRRIQFEKEKTEEISRIKVNFFTNVSHEFKTPLTLIITPLKKLIPSLPDTNPNKKTLGYVFKNAMRLQQLIDELMEFRTIQNKKLTITYQEKDIFGYLRQLSDLFVDMANEYDINYSVDIPFEELIVPMDYSKLEKIISNLLSNAIKNTNSNGIIILSVIWKPAKSGDFAGEIIFNISNTTNVKFPNDISVLFENYFKLDSPNNNTQKGSGIGLAYTHELVELLGGNIQVANDLNELTFKVALPIVHADISVDTLPDSSTNFNYIQEQIELLNHEIKIITDKNDNRKLPTLLIVEDNSELQQYLFDNLVADYRIITAQNGKEAFEQAKTKGPALIISDVMMPVMTGIELCKLLKNETLTSHIPVIMLSAATNNENKIEGLQVGADVYVEKPFDMDFLSLQIKNLLKTREESRKILMLNAETISTEKVQLSKDDLFLNKAIEIVTRNIGNSEFNVDTFAKEMGYSRTVCYSKIKALSDLSINEFILTIRLKTAAKMLLEDEKTVNEIAFEVGFNDPNYFNTCFKRYYNMPPKAYAKDEKN